MKKINVLLSTFFGYGYLTKIPGTLTSAVTTVFIYIAYEILGYADIKFSIIKNLKNFESLGKDEIYDHRKSKFLQIGRDQGFSKSSNINDVGLSYKESAFNNLKSQINKNKYVYGGIGLIVIIGFIALLS